MWGGWVGWGGVGDREQEGGVYTLAYTLRNPLAPDTPRTYARHVYFNRGLRPRNYIGVGSL